MKIFILLVCSLLFVGNLFALRTNETDGIAINVVIADDDIPQEAAKRLVNKMQQALSLCGISDNGYVTRFVMAAKVDITLRDIVPSTPARISQKMDVTFMVGDVIDNKIFDSYTLSLSGIGTNEIKAFISAFQQLQPMNANLQAMLASAKEKIVSYYTDNCNAIIGRAKTLASLQKYDEAIFSLISVPNVCDDCFMSCQKEATIIFQQKIDAESAKLLQKAKTEWSVSPNAAGAMKVSSLIGAINPKASNYNEVIALRELVAAKLKADEKQAWEFEMKKYEDNQIFRKSMVEACKAIGVAFGNGQPKNVTKNVVKYW